MAYVRRSKCMVDCVLWVVVWGRSRGGCGNPSLSKFVPTPAHNTTHTVMLQANKARRGATSDDDDEGEEDGQGGSEETGSSVSAATQAPGLQVRRPCVC